MPIHLNEILLSSFSLYPKMAALRAPCDEAEQRTAEGCWPFPTYGDLLFGVE